MSPSTSSSSNTRSRKSSSTSTGWPPSRKRSKRTRVIIDRCLSKSLARGLAAFAFDVLTLHDVYGNDGQHVEDVTWITEAGEHGFIAFTGNPNIIGVAHEREAILAAGTKVFCIANANHTRDGKALIFGRHILRIIRRSRRPGPCFWRIDPGPTIRYDIP